MARVSLAATRSMMSSGSGEEDDDQQPEQPASLLSKDQDASIGKPYHFAVLSLYVESAKKIRRRTSTLFGRPKKKHARVNTPQPVTSTEGQLWVGILHRASIFIRIIRISYTCMYVYLYVIYMANLVKVCYLNAEVNTYFSDKVAGWRK